MNSRTEIIRYEKNFLSNVVVQINFSPVKRFIEEVPKDIIEKLNNDGYIFQQSQSREVQMNMETGARIETIIPVWVFKAKNDNLVIQLTQNLLKFDFTKYRNFENLLGHVKKVTSLMNNDLNTISRLGLRYINQIDLDETNPLDWKAYINESLISSIEDWCASSKNKIARAMNQIVINEDNYTLNFNYGIYNPIFPNTVIQKQYILDFDCFGKNIDFVDLENSLQEYNLAITESFEKSINEQLREKMVRIHE